MNMKPAKLKGLREKKIREPFASLLDRWMDLFKSPIKCYFFYGTGILKMDRWLVVGDIQIRPTVRRRSLLMHILGFEIKFKS